MAPFRRGQSANPTTFAQGAFSSTESQMGQEVPLLDEISPTKSSAWGMRMRRRSKKKSPKNKKSLSNEEYDPYESDPGESYRDHCKRMDETKTRSCLAVPKILQSNKKAAETSTDTAPQSLDESAEIDHVPRSLPRDLARLRYSLRSNIGDGSEVQGILNMERRLLRPNNVHINVSHWSHYGGRNYMEDRYAIEDMGAVQVEVSPVAVRSRPEDDVEVTFGNRKNRRLKMPLTWLGIFDGHGGDKASQFCADWSSSYIKNEDSYPYDLGFAMKNAFTAIDEDFVATGNPDGSTACTATLVGGRRIVCANAGDSRAIVVRRDGTVVRLSRDHKPGIPDETKRISDLGGRVIYWGRWRVEGLLAVSRSIGDASLKPYVTAEPEVCEYDIGKDDWFLVMSSDGVWDVMDNEEAAHVVIASSCVMQDGKLRIDTNRFKWAARNLVEHAKSCGSMDNFSVLVVDLKSCGNTSAKSGTYEP